MKTGNMKGDTIIRFPDNINVHEYRASTDDSVKLLNEMQEKARKNIMANVLVNDNTINGSVIMYRNLLDTMTIDRVDMDYKFKLNGTEYKLTDSFNMPRILEEASHQELEVFAYNMLKLKIFKVVEHWLKYELAYTLMDKPVDEWKMKQIMEQIRIS